MKNKIELKTKTELKAIIGTIGYMLFAFGIIYSLSRFLNLKIDKVGEISLSIFLLLPLMAYLVFADKIKSFKAGGVEMAFKDFANQNILVDSDPIGDTLQKEIEIIEKKGTDHLMEKLKEIGNQNQSKKILTITLGMYRDYYGVSALKNYLKTLSTSSRFFYVVILNIDKKAIAFINVDNLTKILENAVIAEDFKNALNEGNTKILEFPGIIRESVREDDTNIEVLQKMDKYKINQLLVVDKDGFLKDIVERNELLTKFFISLSSKLKENK